MVDTSVTKYHLVPADLTTNLSIFRTRKRSSVLLYAVVLVFVLFTVFIAFTPSSSSSSYWFMNVLTVNSTSPPPTGGGGVGDPPGSHSPSLFSYFFPSDDDHVGPTSPVLPSQGQKFDPDSHGGEVSRGPGSSNLSEEGNFDPNSLVDEVLRGPSSSTLSKDSNFDPNSHVGEVSRGATSSNFSKDGNLDHVDEVSQGSTLRNSSKDGSVEQNVTESGVPSLSSPLLGGENTTNIQYMAEPQTPNLSVNEVVEEKGEKQSKQSVNATSIAQAPVDSPTGIDNSTKNGNGVDEKGAKEKMVASDNVGSLSRKGGKKGNLIELLVDCDLYDGEWVRDESYPLYKPGSCSLIDEQFNCILNGRPDNDFHKLKWKPKGCTLPRLSGDRMLKFLKGKRLVFVGDSLNRNMWESLVCILRKSVKNKKKVYEAFGRHSFRTGASYSFVFKDYNFTVEFFVAPFLVQQWDFKEKNGETKETLRLDLMVRDNDQFKNADFVVFNTGHWWTHDKTSKGEDYYQEGSHVYKQLDVHEAFRRAITTWARWVDANINPEKTHVLFRGYSASHFSGGQWNSGGQCDSETEPIRNDTYLTPYPWKMTVFESIIKGMKTPVSYLNITRMTDYRKDGHPSIYRKQHITSEDERRSPLKYQDCSHWCLPGVPDSWNELLYAELLRKQYKDRQQPKNRS